MRFIEHIEGFIKQSKSRLTDYRVVLSMMIGQFYLHTYYNEPRVSVWQEGKFDCQKTRFEPVAIVRLPTYRKFQFINLGDM